MIARDELEGVLTLAIREAHINDPRAPGGTTWDQTHLSNEEAHHYAKAVLNVLAQRKLKIVSEG